MLNLTLLLMGAGIGGILAKQLGQSKVLGQILAGILLGPSVLSLGTSTDFISHLAEIGVILLMFLAGLETEVDGLKKSFDKSSWIALGGILLPFVMGFGVIYFYKGDWTLGEAVFTGVMLTATSMGIAISSLSDQKLMKTPVGMGFLGATIIDDVAGVIILSITLGLFGQSKTSILLLISKIVVFFILILWLMKFVAPKINKNIRYLDKLKSSHLLAGSILAVLLFGIMSSEFGLAAIIGAYFVGLILSQTKLRHKVTSEVEKFGVSFFIPLFFINIGISIDLSSVIDHWPLAVLITLVGLVSKLVGSSLGGKISGLTKKESLQIGISMMPRAEVTLIIANLGLKTGLIGPDVYNGAILLVLTSSLVTPIALKIACRQKTGYKQKRLAS